MASTMFPPLAEDNIRTLDQLRQRLSQLATSLGSLKLDLERSHVPTWSSLHTAAQLVSHQLNEVQAVFTSNEAFLKAAHVYPLTTFPAHTHEILLDQLLRKKLEPGVEDWIKRYESVDPDTTGKRQHLKELWSKAGSFSKRIVVQMAEEEAWDDVFTIAEKEAGIENVETGLRRKFWEQDEDDEEQEDEMEDVQHDRMESDSAVFEVDKSKIAWSVEGVLRVLSTGRLPPT